MYSKDDIWVLSTSNDFTTNFLATSTFFGPLSNGMIEICPVSQKDVLKAQYILKGQNGPENVIGIRLLNVCGELCVIPNLIQNLPKSPLLGTVLANDEQTSKSMPLVLPGNANAFITLMAQVSDEFNLNKDQNAVLLSSAKSCIGQSHPITLAHGVC